MNRTADDLGEAPRTIGSTRTIGVPIRTDDGDVFRADVYTAVDVSEDPDLREELFEGTLNEVEGPEGEEVYRPAVAVRYHDPGEEIFALVVPEPLRHRSFELRRELLEELEAFGGRLPEYVVNFQVVCAPETPEELAERTRRAATGSRDRAEVSADLDAEADVDELQRRLDEREEELETREKQLEEVRDRVDREREQMREEFDAERQDLDEMRNELKEMRDEIEREREELEEERQALQAERLNLEDKSRRVERGEPEEPTQHSTQVVTDDQFISMTPTEGEDAIDEDSARPRKLQAMPLERDAVPEQFDEERADGTDGYVEVSGGRVRACGRLSGERLERFAEETPRLFVQFHRVDDVPVAALTVALLDEDGAVVDSFGWPLDLAGDVHSSVLHRLSEEFELEVALYDPDGEIEAAYEFRAPYEENVDWIRNRVEAEREESEVPEEFSEVVRGFQEDDFERVGSMRHNFERGAFHELDSPSRVKLAAGVVGYWSEEEQLEYLISNRTYPLEPFRRLQENVIEEALEYGIFLPEPLRERAVELGLVADDVDLVERQLANFAEVGVQIRDNDLDPIDEWENWDQLIGLAKEIGVTPDPEVLELAEASLQRAKDYQETEEVGAGAGAAEVDDGAEESEEPPKPEEPSVVEAEQQVVGKRSEKTGVMYYLPDSAVLDTFEDMADMPREDLEKLLDDPNGRLEAAQILLDKFGADVVSVVLEAAEQMSAPELTALARFLETKADGLEPQLVRAVETGGPSATFVAARALAEIRSTTALPKLLEAYRDPDRQLNRAAVGRALASYGEKLLPELTSSIQEEGTNEHVVTLLMYLEDEHAGILDDLADHRTDEVREAVERAREQKL